LLFAALFRAGFFFAAGAFFFLLGFAFVAIAASLSTVWFNDFGLR
jgi:hypothetical protein